MTFLIMWVLVAIFAMPFVLLPAIFNFHIPSGFLGTVYLAVPTIVHVVLIIAYYKKNYPLFALPLGHLLFPFLVIALIFLTTTLLTIMPASLANDGLLGLIVISFIYSWPFALVTLIISIIIRARERLLEKNINK